MEKRKPLRFRSPVQMGFVTSYCLGMAHIPAVTYPTINFMRALIRRWVATRTIGLCWKGRRFVTSRNHTSLHATNAKMYEFSARQHTIPLRSPAYEQL